ncbi:hypothetical protein [Chryseobacterium jejuense]|uniref:Beta-1,6-galactofuranosyltransferase n=1 Tax=Chryseobacterium jejuense TaxID=445960 RepID=A0A2X2X571_CHRJE|nr:hypothetical protein [Chryseobacterium jejuense]SDJ35254.1 hypothetical protein SAMN05421542_3276 [Chryseobacterium jejuense]SQB45781.1 beta-1,6-galactofuranosyltransferase [Chryseobacterium jejuense]
MKVVKNFTFDFTPNWSSELKNIASAKPRDDAKKITIDNGFIDILPNYNGFGIKGKLLSLMKVLISILKLPQKSKLFIQYPIQLNYLQFFLPFLLSLKQIEGILYVHDVISIRAPQHIDAKTESKFFNNFKKIILHNNKMIDVLKPLLNKDRTVFSLNIFDYLLNDDFTENQNQKTIRDEIVISGNLGRSVFVKNLYQIKNNKFHLYGPFYENEREDNNVIYHGSVSPEELNDRIKNYDFGLIWDGDKIESLSNGDGNYMKYNNPFKFSAYIAAGLPIITSKEAGIAKFVKEQNIGVLVDSLYDLDNFRISEVNYKEFKNNVLNLRIKLIKGQQLSSILQKILN